VRRVTLIDAGTGEVVDSTIPLSSVVLDLSIYPRAEWSARTVERYSDALAAGETLPPIIVEADTLRLLDGLHRLKARTALGETVVEVERHQIPRGIPAKLYAASLSARHGDRMTGEDLKAVAREVFTIDPDASQAQVGRMLGVSQNTISRWCSDISERRRNVRQVKALLLTRSGMSLREAGELLGVNHQTVSNDIQADIPSHFDELLTEALEGLPPQCAAVADELREELVFAKWSDEERSLLERHRSGETVVVNLHRHQALIAWSQANGVYEQVDRKTKWGNPFEMPADGDRATVIANYRDHYLPHKPSLLKKLPNLTGKLLGCWCHPEPCHGDILAEGAEQ
jgi:transcriptional regulator with XRE-family HTH domain